MNQILPVPGHLALRAWRWLIQRMRVRWLKLRALEEFSGAVIVEPIFAGLETVNHGMPGRVEMSGGMLFR